MQLIQSAALVIGIVISGALPSLASTPILLTKDVSGLFPGVTIPPTSWAFVGKNTPEYSTFFNCSSQQPSYAGLAANCSVLDVQTPKFYDFTVENNVGVTESLAGPATFSQLNHCVTVRPGSREVKAPVGFSSPGVVECLQDGDHIVIAHLLVCYGKVTPMDAGAYCTVATTCFEPPPFRNRCLRDQPGEEVHLAYTGVNSGTPPAIPPGCTSTNDCRNSASQCVLSVKNYTCPDASVITGVDDCACPGKFIHSQPFCPGLTCMY